MQLGVGQSGKLIIESRALVIGDAGFNPRCQVRLGMAHWRHPSWCGLGRTDLFQAWSRSAPLAIIDAELVACSSAGIPDFRKLHFSAAPSGELCLWAFDLLHLRGWHTGVLSNGTRSQGSFLVPANRRRKVGSCRIVGRYSGILPSLLLARKCKETCLNAFGFAQRRAPGSR
jgi:hypothetical protein